MALRKRPIAAGIAALLLSGYVSALGLGEIRLNSALNEPLDAEIPLLNLGELSEGEIIAGLASRSDFDNAGVERELILSGLLFNLDFGAAGGPVLRVFSQKPIREPYLDFLVDVQWPAGRLLREYTLLLDLPVYAGGTFTKKKANAPVTSAGARQSASSRAQAASSSSYGSSSGVVAGDQQYVVREGDTLWRIASTLPSSDSVHQRMADIQQLNPGAFINGDINLLKKGAVLRFPATGVGAPAAAGAAFESQTQPGSSGAQLSGSSREVSAPAATEADGRLSLSASNENRGQGEALGAGGSGSSALRSEIDSIQEELDRAQRENAQLKQRLSSMEEQFATMQRLLELEDDDLRAVQLAAGAEPRAGEEASLAGSDSNETESLDSSQSASLEPEPSQSLALFPSANVGGARSAPEKSGISSSEGLARNGSDQVSVLENQDQAKNTVPAKDKQIKSEEVSNKPATSVEKSGFKTEKGWFEKVSGYLTYILGLLVVVIGAIVFLVLRKGKSQNEDEGYSETFQEPAVRFAPPPATLRSEPSPAQEQQPQASSLDEIDLKAEDDLFADAPAQDVPKRDTDYSQAAQVPADDVELDLSEFDLDAFGADEPEPSAAATEAEAVVDHLNLDEDFDFLGDIDEGDTQLKLAQAYLEMGDNAGAKEILMEVAEGGSDDQKAKARELLEKIG
ncbi:MAG: FimV/HubP family polar landmark protein, partial [Porticoccaceae bacterium]